MTITPPFFKSQSSAFGDVVAKPQVAADSAVDFLRQFDPTGWHNLVAIEYRTDDDGKESKITTGRTFAPGQWAEMQQWIAMQSGRANCYFSVNEPKPHAPDKKLSKADIARVRAIFVDLDPSSAEVDNERRRLSRRIAEFHPDSIPPTAIVDSGGGIQAHWLLTEKIDSSRMADWAENQGRAFADALGGDNVQNLNRIMRLPGTLNIPGMGKAAKGRTRRHASVVSSDFNRRYKPTALSNVVPPAASAVKNNDTSATEAFDAIDYDSASSVSGMDDLSIDLQERFDAGTFTKIGVNVGDRISRWNNAAHVEEVWSAS